MLRTSETVSSISAALCKALIELEDIKREGQAIIPTKSGGSFSYKYATLPNVLQSVRGVLAKYDLAIMQNAFEGGNNHVLIGTMIVHASGEYMMFDPLAMPMGHTPQETGSAITYGRRYHILAVLGLSADDDDDASAISSNGTISQSSNPQHANTTIRVQTDPSSTIRVLSGSASEKQIGYLKGACKRAGIVPPTWLDSLTKQDASAFIEAEKNGEPVAAIIARMASEEPF